MALASRIALVTGGASGLGKATVLRFARAGAKVAILDLPSQPGAELVKFINNGNVIFCPADVTKEAEVCTCCVRNGTGPVLYCGS